MLTDTQTNTRFSQAYQLVYNVWYQFAWLQFNPP